MGVFSAMFPVLPGKEDAARAWTAEAGGPRRAEFDAFQRRAKLTRETITLQRTPAGAVLLIWFEGDIERAFEVIATGEDAFTAWYRGQLHDVTGVDVRQPAAGPPPETLLDWYA